VTEPRTVRVLTRKWPDEPHWEFDAVRLGVDGLGHWLGVPRGTWLSKPDKGFTAWADHVVLVPHDDWWVATIYGLDADRPVDVYVDMTTPCIWSEDGSEARCVDLDLDVIRETDGLVRVDDEDEFAEHQVALGYPAEVVRGARRSCEEVLAAVRGGEPPYDGSAYRWIAKVQAYRS
jgi:hypothetical protein